MQVFCRAFPGQHKAVPVRDLPSASMGREGLLCGVSPAFVFDHPVWFPPLFKDSEQRTFFFLHSCPSLPGPSVCMTKPVSMWRHWEAWHSTGGIKNPSQVGRGAQRVPYFTPSHYISTAPAQKRTQSLPRTGTSVFPHLTTASPRMAVGRQSWVTENVLSHHHPHLLCLCPPRQQRNM